MVGKLDIYTQIISTPLPDKAAPPAAPLADKAGALDAWFVATTDYLSHLTRCQTELSDQKRFRSLLKAALEAYRTNAEEQERLDKLLPRLKQALVVCEDERRKFTDGILTAISNEVGRIYEKMHPGEGLSKITFQLDAAKRASLAIGSLCYGQDNAPPQAFFSESHLDTLGLCFFLALAKNGNSADTILVLDDVLASVDEPHVDRVIETLYEEAAHFRHCLITTHYRPWKEKLRWGWLKTGQCQFVELTKWSQSEGLRHTKSTPDIARLRLLLAEGEPDAQLVCAKAGVVLEAILDFLTRQYQCRVPRRPGGAYTLGDLLPALSSKLCNHLKLERLKEISDTGSPVFEERLLRPDIDELKRIAQVRNVFGCHFNDISFSLLGAEAIPFGQRVLEIAEWLIDEEAGWPAKERAGSYWSNSDDTRRLHPLKEPQ